MDYETVSPEEFGASLRGVGLNLVVRDVARTCGFLGAVFDMECHRKSEDFAIGLYGSHVFQIHSDATYHANALLGLLPEAGPRGAGIELRLYDTDPDVAASRTEAAGGTVLAAPVDKPHGLREAVILDPDGYAWVPSRPLTPNASKED